MLFLGGNKPAPRRRTEARANKHRPEAFLLSPLHVGSFLCLLARFPRAREEEEGKPCEGKASSHDKGRCCGCRKSTGPAYSELRSTMSKSRNQKSQIRNPVRKSAARRWFSSWDWPPRWPLAGLLAARPSTFNLARGLVVSPWAASPSIHPSAGPHPIIGGIHPGPHITTGTWLLTPHAENPQRGFFFFLRAVRATLVLVAMRGEWWSLLW